MSQVVALVGLSGVGKSVLVRRVQTVLPLLHLQASDLIKAEEARRRRTMSSSEELRLGPVLDNQQLLINGFMTATQGVSKPVVFDGHAVIFGEDSATVIPSSVFGELGCAAIVMIDGDPATIRAQRQHDTTRVRPDVDEAVLGSQQAYVKDVAARIALDLCVPFHCIAAGAYEALVEVLLSTSEQRLGGEPLL